MKKIFGRTSITHKLFFNVFFVIMIFCALILLANTLLIGPLYRIFTVKSINESMNEILEIDFSQRENIWLREINAIERKNTFEIEIFKKKEFFYASSFQPRMIDQEKMIQNPKLIQRIQDERRSYTPEQLIHSFARKNRKKVAHVVGEKGQYTFVISQFLQPVNNTIKQANILVLIITLLSVVFAGIYTNKLAKSFTLPIMQIKRNVARLTNLDFSKTCTVDTKDELEMLAGDINSLAFKLESTLDELKVKNAKLENDIDSQRKFISNASHELRTPLSLIQGYADEIKNGFVSDEAQKSAYIDIISQETVKMNRLLKDMLELSRMQSGNLQFIMQELSVKEQISTFVEKYDGFIMDRNLNMSFEFDEANDVGCFDSVRFEQVLANYISNASKYGDDNKIIKIFTEVFEDCIRIYVYNSGKHIDEKIFNQLSGRFYKGELNNDHVENSYGLGLSIVLAIQDTLKQKCGVLNQKEGVCFWFDVIRKKSTQL